MVLRSIGWWVSPLASCRGLWRCSPCGSPRNIDYYGSELSSYKRESVNFKVVNQRVRRFELCSLKPKMSKPVSVSRIQTFLLTNRFTGTNFTLYLSSLDINNSSVSSLFKGWRLTQQKVPKGLMVTATVTRPQDCDSSMCTFLGQIIQKDKHIFLRGSHLLV